MANRLAMDKVQAILNLRASGMSQRRIAAALGIDRKAVRRHLDAASSKGTKAPTGEAPTGSEESKGAKTLTGPEAAGEDLVAEPIPAASEPLSRSSCEPFREQIIEMLERGLSAQRIHQDLVSDHGFTSRYSAVRRFVAGMEGTDGVPFRRMEVEPGYEAQVDFGTGAAWIDHLGKRRRSHVLRLVLSHSRKGYSESVPRQTTECFIRTIENAFWAWGGVPRTLVIDNLKAAVSKADWFDPELNPKIVSFSKHYNVAILPTKPYTPRHKGKVERGVDYVQENALKGHSFETLALQNDHLQQWERTVADTRIHGTTKKHVGRLFDTAERPALQPLPAERFPFFDEGQRKVSRDGHIAVAQSYYSVPLEYLTRTVWVRWDNHTVRVFNHRWEQIAMHARVEAGKFSTDAPHIASEKISGVERGAKYLLGKVQILGPQSARWAEAMLAARGIEGVRVLQGLLALSRKYSCDQIEAACETAWRGQAYQVRIVRKLLERGAAAQQTLEFIEEHPLIRPLSEYGDFVHQSIQGGIEHVR